jgi:hypothetical protein
MVVAYRLSGRLTFALHLCVLAVISPVYASIDGGLWWPPATYLAGAIMLWIASTPGAKRRLLSQEWGMWHHLRMVARHGTANEGHPDRATWDRYGRHSRYFLHALCIFLVGVIACQQGFRGGFFWQTLLMGASFALGVEIGFLAFKDGDEAEWRRQRRAVPLSRDD